MEKKIIENVQECLTKYNLKQSRKPILIALSGGPDSVVLMHIVHHLGFKVEVAHCNFKLRPESDEEAEFVQKTAQLLGIPAHIRAWDTRSEMKGDSSSIQMKARELRYSFFEELLTRRELDYCLTAHHMDDQIETLIMSLFRGSKQVIMEGIPEKRGPYIRPFLNSSKEEILAYAKENEIEYRLDVSNEKNDYLRNQIRNLLIPLIGGINPSFGEMLIEKDRKLGILKGLLEDQANEVLLKFIRSEGDKQIIPLERLNAIENAEQRAMILGAAVRKLGFSNTISDEVAELIEGGSGRKLVDRGKVLLNDREQLVIYPLEKESSREWNFSSADLLPFEGVWDGLHVKLEVLKTPDSFGNANEEEIHWLDFDSVSWPLKCRTWKDGDRMQPFGMEGNRKLSDIMIDLKWDLYQKSKALVLEDQDQILCLSGFRIAQKGRITPDSQKCIRLTISKPNENI